MTPNRKTMLVLCPFPEGVAAGQRLKYEQYFDDWAKSGFDIDVSPFMDPAFFRIVYERGHFWKKVWGTLRGHVRRLGDVMRVRRYSVVYVFMYVTPLGTTVLERMTRRLARKLIYDVEDNVVGDVDPLVKGHPNSMVRSLRGKGKARFLIQTADHVITSAPALNELCMRINERRACTYISSSVDTDRFVPANPYSNDNVVTIGWTGTFSSRPFLDLLRPVFQQLAKRRTFKLRVIGNFDYELPGVDLEVIRWSVEREVEDLQGIDIGVYPLPVDDWVTGKSGLKAIQYMAFAIPCVATNVGTTPLIIRHGDNGLLATSDDDWLTGLETLIDDPALRRRLGEQARRDAVERYSTKAVAADYRRVIDSVMADR
ncbi:MAG TPA: glycosyltransferase [Sphingomicrobium sp.]|nr:glycosyltransferase [Sphingomicrobium sp.]